MRKSFAFSTIILAAFMLVSIAGTCRAQQTFDMGGKDHLVFFLPSKETAITKQIMDLWEKVGETIGVPIKVMTIADSPIENPNTDQIIAWAKELARNNVIDITILAPTGLFRIQELGAKFRPIATYTMDKKKFDKPCILVRKDSPYLEIEGDKERLEAMKGKDVSMGCGLRSNPAGDMLLMDHGITTPSHEYFNYIGGYGGIDSFIIDTVQSNIEGLITFKIDTKFAKEKKLLMELKPLVCGNEYTNMPLIVREGLDIEIVKRIRKMILTIHKNQAFPQLKFLFAAIAGHFVPVSMEEYDNWRAIYDKGMKEGWMDDFGQAIYPITVEHEEETIAE